MKKLQNLQKKKFNKISEENIEKVHLLFMSSAKYNYSQKKSCKGILKNKRINCIFYDLKKKLFFRKF